MSTVANPPKIDARNTDLCRKRFYSVDFSEQDLSDLKMKYSLFHNCSFDRANMSNTDCEGSEFFGSTFRETTCYRTNFKDAKLANTVFQPKDAFGITLTLHCKTFENMQVSQIWYYGWLILASLMQPAHEPIPENLKDKLIEMIGGERYAKLRALFGKRDL